MDDGLGNTKWLLHRDPRIDCLRRMQTGGFRVANRSKWYLAAATTISKHQTHLLTNLAATCIIVLQPHGHRVYS